MLSKSFKIEIPNGSLWISLPFTETALTTGFPYIESFMESALSDVTAAPIIREGPHEA